MVSAAAANADPSSLPLEIERRFLVNKDLLAIVLRRDDPHDLLRQAYLCADPERVVRVRITEEVAREKLNGRPTDDGPSAEICVKGKKVGFSCPEVESAIHVADAERMMELRIGNAIVKRRYRIPEGSGSGLFWEVDIYEGDLAGLVTAEIELPEVTTEFRRPEWLGAEVSSDHRYSNLSLALNGLPVEA